MADTVSIVNRALLSIGAKAQVSSIQPSDGSREADAAAVLFTPTFEALARTAYWNCLRKQIALSVIAAAQGTPENPLGTSLPLPPSPWQYAYQLPSDSLMVRWIQPNLIQDGGGNPPATTYNNTAPTIFPIGRGEILFQVAYDTDPAGNPIQVILTNQPQAQCVYTVNQPNPVVWDSLFQEAMVASLASYFVPALSLNLTLMQLQIKRAEGMIAQARVRDGNEGYTSQDNVPDWIRARGGTNAGGWGFGYGINANYANYISMVWPG